MTVLESVKEAVGFGGDNGMLILQRRLRQDQTADPSSAFPAAPASREAMSEARIPLQYRDSCANLLIPLNKCRHENSWMPWRCEVSGWTL